MKKINILMLMVAFAGIFQLVGCSSGGDDPKPVTDLIKQKIWKAKEVQEKTTSNTTFEKVYVNGQANNIKEGYSKFRLAFTSATAVELTEYDGTVFKGTWALENNNTTLKLSNLVPTPTGVTTIEYISLTVTETELNLTRTTNNPKSGASTTQYNLF